MVKLTNLCVNLSLIYFTDINMQTLYECYACHRKFYATGVEEFEDAIRKFGIVNTCEYFGYSKDDEFTLTLLKDLTNEYI